MNKKRLYAAFLSLALALGAAAAMLWYAQHADERALEGIQATSVFVASADIPAGTTLESAVKNKWLRIEQIPRRLAPSGSGTDVDPNNSRNVAASDIHTGELVMLTRFVSPRDISAGLAIPVGKIAVSLNLEDPQRVGNFVRVGAKVAVFSTTKTGSDYTTSRTRLLLADLLVLGVGDSTGDTPTSGQAASKLITLAVTKDEAETLINATNVGSLYFALMTSQSGVAATSEPTYSVAPSTAPTTAP